MKPDYVFDSSWEVCNKVGGIYTFLSTRANTLQQKMQDNVFFIRPDLSHENTCPYYKEDAKLIAE